MRYWAQVTNVLKANWAKIYEFSILPTYALQIGIA